MKIKYPIETRFRAYCDGVLTTAQFLDLEGVRLKVDGNMEVLHVETEKENRTYCIHTFALLSVWQNWTGKPWPQAIVDAVRNDVA